MRCRPIPCYHQINFHIIKSCCIGAVSLFKIQQNNEKRYNIIDFNKCKYIHALNIFQMYILFIIFLILLSYFYYIKIILILTFAGNKLHPPVWLMLMNYRLLIRFQ